MKAGEEQNGSRKGWDVERGGMEGKGQEVGMCMTGPFLRPLTSVVACF